MNISSCRPVDIHGASASQSHETGSPNNAFHLPAALAFARASAGECERSPHD